MPGPPVRLEQWLRAYEDGVEAPDHADDNKPVEAAPIGDRTAGEGGIDPEGFIQMV
jgi:hypothetical protein